MIVKKGLAYLSAIGSYIVRKVLLYAAGVIILVFCSFLVWPPLSAATLSERLVWAGIGVALIAGILVFGQAGGGGSNYGVPGQFINSAHASALIDWNIEIRKNIDSRFDFRFQVFLIGAIIFLVGVLVDVGANLLK